MELGVFLNGKIVFRMPYCEDQRHRTQLMRVEAAEVSSVLVVETFNRLRTDVRWF
jgi:hypothetical protein